jgi:hypothetical protein
MKPKATMTKSMATYTKTPSGTKVSVTKGKPTQMKMKSISEKEYFKK